ncbi:hypothetical protein EJ06DRAFT_507154 [Trichodelitschia bisporula]|uniref:Zn(2)-C6 fungal-type domain-containing protein n=1 Tax=Trichodelitschia bisporula TaxID=703511 RepID=A0A6G1I311_9PEZI|nr:hypothetical protein EJ06DRAFT_507154 [Trichodelitschia bisporula]
MDANDASPEFLNPQHSHAHNNATISSQTPNSTFFSPLGSPSVTQNFSASLREPPSGTAPPHHGDQHPGRKRKRSITDTKPPLESLSTHHGFPAPHDSPTHSNTELDSYIKSKRKPREKKACRVCRRRKVGCDQHQPCQNCIDRRYPELCVYENATGEPGPPSVADGTQGFHHDHHLQGASLVHQFDSAPSLSPRQAHSSPPPYVGDTVTLPRESFDRLVSTLETLRRTYNDLTADMKKLTSGVSSSANPPHYMENGQNPSAFLQPVARVSQKDDDENHMHGNAGIHTRNKVTGQTIHIGSNSVPALVMSYSPHLEELLGTSILPAFGLENESATYPFVGLSDLKQGRIAKILDLCRALPSEQECNRFFMAYRDSAYILYPAMTNVARFNEDLRQFSRARAAAQAMPGYNGVNEQTIYGHSLSWMGLLFAAMASGCQCIKQPGKELDLTSQVFVCCSFECLRLTNFFSNPSLDNIQTLLILGNVISNSMNAGVAWSLLGLTIRLAMVLGLHKESCEGTPATVKEDRIKVAWAILWQDSLLSITFDRNSALTSLDLFSHGIPPEGESPNGYTYAGCMYKVCKVGLDIVRERAVSQDPLESLQRMSVHEAELRKIMARSELYLKSLAHCRTPLEQLQHWAMYLHISYIMSEVCREAIKPRIPTSDLTIRMRTTCIESLANTVKAFLGLYQITAFASRSWAALSRALSSAFVLGILGEAARDESIRLLLSDLLGCLHDIMQRNTDDIDEISAPIKRWATSLAKLTSTSPVGTTGMSPLLELDSDDSPYARAEEIIWG